MIELTQQWKWLNFCYTRQTFWESDWSDMTTKNGWIFALHDKPFRNLIDLTWQRKWLNFRYTWQTFKEFYIELTWQRKWLKFCYLWQVCWNLIGQTWHQNGWSFATQDKFFMNLKDLTWQRKWLNFRYTWRTF